MPNDSVLQLLGLARKAGRLEIGEEPVGAACRARQAKLILLAADAAANSCRRAAHFGQAGNVLQLTLPFTKAELGGLLGRSACAMLALTDTGFSASVLAKLARRDPERYGPAASQLRDKADKVLQRQKEQRRHEKKLRESGSRPWAPPPRQSGAKSPPKPPAACRLKPRPPGKEGSPQHAKGGPGRAPAPSPGGRRLSGKFRHNP